jgi:large subunit ribosomal protein L18
MKKQKKTTIIPHRRRREDKTDYHLRLRLLKSGKPRFVVRRSLNNILCQVIAYERTGDRVLAAADSKELRKMGWTGHTGNIPSAYLTGLLCGVRAKGKATSCVFDMGLYASTKGSRLYSALKGALDAGLQVPHSSDILPSAERLSGKHAKTDLSKAFEQVKAKILKAPPKAPKPAAKPKKAPTKKPAEKKAVRPSI